MEDSATRQQAITALQWYVDNGLTTCVQDEPVNRLEALPDLNDGLVPDNLGQSNQQPQNILKQAAQTLAASPDSATAQRFLGKSEAYEQAVKLAMSASSIEELKEAIEQFDGIALKKTASNMVFADGNPNADIMIIGDAPGADEDRLGAPFTGASGQMLDDIFSYIDLSRSSEEASKSIYMSYIVNWRPPGNRTPAPAEIDVSLPFIERHIQLVNPKILLIFGGVAAKALLGRSDSISRLRGKWHDYLPQTKALQKSDAQISAIVTYPLSRLSGTPSQKRFVWADLLAVHKRKSDK